MQHSRPQLAFHQHQQRRTQRLEVRAHGPAEIEREVEHAPGSEPFPRQRLRAAGRGGDQKAPAPAQALVQGLTEFLHQARSGQDLAYADRVNPNHLLALNRVAEPLRNPAQTLGQAFPVAVRGQHTGHPPRRAQQQAGHERAAVQR